MKKQEETVDEMYHEWEKNKWDGDMNDIKEFSLWHSKYVISTVTINVSLQQVLEK